MDKDLELFYEYLESPLWIHPITLFISELYCAYAYNYNFQNGKNDEMNRKFYHKYCAMLGELLEEFSFDYELDTSKVSQLINTCIEKALPVAKHLIAVQSYKLFVELMRSYTIELKMQSSVESSGLPHLTGKLTKSSCLYDQKCLEKKMEEFAKQKGHSLLMERRLALQQSRESVGNKVTQQSPHSPQQQLTQANLHTPGMAVAMAYGFIAYENTVEYKMKKWYAVEKAQKTDVKQAPHSDVGECNITIDHVAGPEVDENKASCLNTSNPHNHQQMPLPRRNSKRKTSLRSHLDNIPEVSEDHAELNKTV